MFPHRAAAACKIDGSGLADATADTFDYGEFSCQVLFPKSWLFNCCRDDATEQRIETFGVTGRERKMSCSCCASKVTLPLSFERGGRVVTVLGSCIDVG